MDADEVLKTRSIVAAILTVGTMRGSSTQAQDIVNRYVEVLAWLEHAGGPFSPEKVSKPKQR